MADYWTYFKACVVWAARPAVRIHNRLYPTWTGNAMILASVMVFFMVLFSVADHFVSASVGSAAAVLLYNPTARATFAMLGWYHVGFYGASGSGADEGPAIQAAVDAAAASAVGRGMITFGLKDYIVNTTVMIPVNKGIIFRGWGAGGIAQKGTVLRRSAAGSGHTMIDTAGTGSFVNRINFDMYDLVLDGANLPGRVLHCKSGSECLHRRVHFLNVDGTGVEYQQHFNSWVDHCYFQTMGKNGQSEPAVLMGAFATNTGGCDTVHFIAPEFEGNKGTDFKMHGDSANSAPVGSIYVTDVKMEGGLTSQNGPYVHYGYCGNCGFKGGSIGTGSAPRTGPLILSDNSNFGANSFSAMALNGAGVVTYTIDMTGAGSRLMLQQIKMETKPVNAYIHIGSSVGVGALYVNQLRIADHTLTRFQDDRATKEYLGWERLSMILPMFQEGATQSYVSGHRAYLFADAATQGIIGQVRVPGKAIANKAMKYVATWSNSVGDATKDVRWSARTSVNVAGDTNTGAGQVNVTIATPAVADALKVSEFVGGTVGPEKIIGCGLYRVGADVLDTSTGISRVHTFEAMVEVEI